MEQINLIIAAMDEEVQALLNHLDDYQNISLDDDIGYRFSLKNETYILIKGYIGKSNTAFLLGKLSKMLNIKRVFNIGTSGGVNKSLKINDVVIATKVAYYDVDVTFFNYKKGQIPGFPLFFDCDVDFFKNKTLSNKFSIKEGIILSGDYFVTKENISSLGIDTSSCLCVEMEAAAVGHICHRLNIPFVIIRSLSDLVFKSIDLENHDNDIETSSTNAALVLLDLIK